MIKIKLPRDRKGDELMPYVLSKDGRHEVVAPVFCPYRRDKQKSSEVKALCRLSEVDSPVCRKK